MRLSLQGWDIKITSSFYNAGKDEFGTPYDAESYHITIQRKDGKRLAHNSAFRGCEVEMSPDGFDFFGDIREEAMIKAECLKEKISIRNIIDTSYWSEVSPVYGSIYYQENYQRWEY